MTPGPASPDCHGCLQKSLKIAELEESISTFLLAKSMESPPDMNDSKRKKSPFDVNDSLSHCFQIAQKLKLRLSTSDPPGKAEDHSDSDSEIVFGPSLSPTASNELSDTVPLLDQDASQNTTPPQASVHRPQLRDEPRPNPWACLSSLRRLRPGRTRPAHLTVMKGGVVEADRLHAQDWSCLTTSQPCYMTRPSFPG
ncbi:hypothetical protein AAFF_G00136340 [Aldrovandia affinis]|uniref:Uncharacterized protein n=1 Tax=Aldrovandia affinis TaxID=143900 RepID=A0AAD7W983_9TELE|nr:hypothetical protein AAFF_G00136340 [Aldrovandia affinis]